MDDVTMIEYESPIQLMIREINEQRENEIWSQTYKILESYDIKVDKDELIKALSYDRNQYEKGYREGYRTGYHEGYDKGYDEGYNKGYDDMNSLGDADETE